MEILYIWVLKYKNFIRQGFNFSSELSFDMKTDDLEENFVLSITKNKEHIEGLFGKKNIVNITGIIGQNGTGKSNILDFIKQTFPDGSNSITAISVIALKDTETKKSILLIPDNLKIQVEDSTENFEKVIYYDNQMPDEILYNGDTAIADLIFYSNIFDFREEDFSVAGFDNYSTNALFKYGSESWRETDLHENNYTRYKNNEIRMNLEFLLSQHQSLLDFNLPEILDIDVKRLNKLLPPSKDKDFWDTLYASCSTTRDEKQRALDLFCIAFLYNYSLDNRNIVELTEEEKYEISDRKQYISIAIINFFSSLKQKKIQYDGEPIDYSWYDELSTNGPKFISQVEYLLNSSKLKLNINNGLDLALKYSISDNGIDELIQLLKLYMLTKISNDFFDFNWRNLSSGEQSFFSFVSRFNHIKNHKILHEELRKNIIILIDEGDAYFHPEWQRKLFRITLEFLTSIFKEHKIQLILCSNAPFLTSDLPKSHLIFLEKNSDNSTIVHNHKNDRKETFGANIHSLLSDSFYMKGALIGEFAKSKIQEIINYLNTKNPTPRPDYKNTIDIIGEPVLQKKLRQMWVSKFGIDEAIADLKNQIELLEKKKKDDKNRN